MRFSRPFSLGVSLLALLDVRSAAARSGEGGPPDNGNNRKNLINAEAYAAATARGSRAPARDHATISKKSTGSEPGSSLGSSFIEHFSAQASDASSYLYDLFDPYSNSNHSGFHTENSDALHYAVTHTHPSAFLSYFFAPENAEIVHISPLDSAGLEGEVDGRGSIVYKEYISPTRRRDGPGGIGMDVRFKGWKVDWRGVQMDVWGANWLEGAFMSGMSQTHIIVTSVPSYLSPSPPRTLLSMLPDEVDVTDDTLEPSISADLASSLFILEVNEFVNKLEKVVLVFDNYWQPDRALWESVQKADWKDVILDEDLKKDLVHEYRSFYASEGIYKSLGVPWKRGMIYLGPPGNGKTISLKATMKDVGVPLLYVKSFHSWGGDEMGIEMIFERARQEAPCLLIMEDLDSLITEENRSFFLNQLDGITDNDGLLLIGTTNHFDKLDPAVSNRPSRFDRKYTFPNPNQQERYAYAVYWQDKLKGNKRVDYPDSLLQTFAEQTVDFSFAYMKEAFVSTLLSLAGDGTGEMEFPSILLKQVAILRKDLEAGNEDVATGDKEISQPPAKEVIQEVISRGFTFWRV